jgi:hypothetical protein
MVFVEKGALYAAFICFSNAHFCLAGRRYNKYTRLGRIPLSRSHNWDSWGLSRKGTNESEVIPSTSFEDGRESVPSVRLANLLKRQSPEESIDKASSPSSKLSIQVSSPIIPQDVWDDMTGEEWNDPSTVDHLASSGLLMAAADENEWIEWNAHKDTTKILEEKDTMSALDEGEVLVYVGKAKKEGYGSQLPIIKTKSILPLSAEEMADLLMDSSRVKIYNKLSLGRKDIRQLGENTKIVQNLTKPPITKSNMVSVTLMHSRRLQEPEKEGYLVVSRAVPGAIDEEFSGLPRNDILLGINLLQDLGSNECLMTAVTHIYSPSLPTMLARKLGVSSAINFIKDIRNVCEPVAN